MVRQYALVLRYVGGGAAYTVDKDTLEPHEIPISRSISVPGERPAASSYHTSASVS